MTLSSADSKPVVAVAGASGFVGSHLRARLSNAFRFRALTRSSHVAERNVEQEQDSTEWRQCDLYSLPALSQALEGCDYGIYLVHSMEPSSRLTQGNFEDTDLILADNFIRAAEAAGLRHVIYLSGLIPQPEVGLSPHLRSRKEVESVLRSRSVQVTVLRAGLIFGAGGSSFSMLVNLVRRLPLMILPAWASSKTHSIDVENVCDAFRLCMEDADLAGGTYDLGGHQPMLYRDLIRQTAALLGRSPLTIHFPFNCFMLSKHWVALFGGVPTALVGPLQESLKHDLEARPNPLLERLRDQLIPLEVSLRRGIDAEGRPQRHPRSETQKVERRTIREARRVRSVQRMPLPPGWSAPQIAYEYGEWLSRRFGGLLKADKGADGVLRFRGPGRLLLLELTPTALSVRNQRRCAFYISGGLLSRNVDPPGRFEFRLFPENDCLIASVHGFAPTLPWWFYARTQAVIHLKVMRAFARRLRQIVISAEKPSEAGAVPLANDE